MQNWSHLRTTTFTATTTTDHEEYITHKKLNEWAMGEHVFWKSVWWFLQKVKHNTVIRPNNSTPKQEKQSTQRTCKYSEQHYSSTPPPPKKQKKAKRRKQVYPMHTMEWIMQQGQSSWHPLCHRETSKNSMSEKKPGAKKGKVPCTWSTHKRQTYTQTKSGLMVGWGMRGDKMF